MHLEVETRIIGDRTVIAVTGDLDVLSAPELRNLLAQLVEGGQVDLAVDLRSTQFIDSSGLSALVTGLKVARAAGGDLVLVCPAGHVRRLIQVLALDQVFELLDEPPTAQPG